MDNLVLINKKNRLSSDYVPNNLIICDDNRYNFHQYLDPKLKPIIREDVYYQFEKLHNTALEDGFDIIIDSGYRSYNYQYMLYQSELWKNHKEIKKKYPLMNPSEQFYLAEFFTKRQVALPGHSEHQTGLALDFAIMSSGEYSSEVENTLESKWMMDNAYKYGFILRYPKGKENVTGYFYEPWHYRYVGLPYSKEMYDDNLTLEEYHKLVLKK